MPPRKWMERGAPLARTPLTNTCSGVPSKASRLTALVIESLETSKRAPFVLVDEGQRREVARDDRSLEGKIGSVGLGLSDAGSPGGVRRAIEAADRLHRIHSAPLAGAQGERLTFDAEHN